MLGDYRARRVAWRRVTTSIARRSGPQSRTDQIDLGMAITQRMYMGRLVIGLKMMNSKLPTKLRGAAGLVSRKRRALEGYGVDIVRIITRGGAPEHQTKSMIC